MTARWYHGGYATLQLSKHYGTYATLQLSMGKGCQNSTTTTTTTTDTHIPAAMEPTVAPSSTAS